MTKRQCLECNGELVLAFRPSENGRITSGSEDMTTSNAKWRCSICGHSFSAEELRAGALARAKRAG